MPTEPIFLPNGYVYTVTPVFGGMTFKHNEINISHSTLPPGWNIVVHTERFSPTSEKCRPESPSNSGNSSSGLSRPGSGSRPQSPSRENRRTPRSRSFRFTKPTLDRDCLFISSLFFPSSRDFKSPSSPTRQIAMMLWATLWWYFHLPEPNRHVSTPESALTPEPGRPKGEWRVYIKREGVLKGRNLMQKLERMGLVTCEDSSVGLDPADPDYQDGWREMYVSRRRFWQLDPRIFLFTLQPVSVPPVIDIPHFSRPDSPPSGSISTTSPTSAAALLGPENAPFNPSMPGGPFYSGSHLPTFFPPAPPLYTFTNGTRHPIRPKPPRQGETFYVRYIRSVAQTLSFRVPVLKARESVMLSDLNIRHRKSASATSIADMITAGSVLPRSENESDLDVLHRWMNNPRINAAWGAAGPRSIQDAFLRKQLTSTFSFPALGCWDGKPFGYFEIYWIKEANIAKLLLSPVGNWDRGFHCLIGEEEYRSSHRVQIWLSALVHYCWLADNRTENVILEPRVDNERLISSLHTAGFYKDGEVAFPHKQAAVMRMKRDNWEAPVI
ncbi:aerobactin siderophore biosynthesis protein iucB [Coccidioides immitis H538.4]|uniref:Aerobactin siderophore biosynthesis protein iucB n=2 Tax=Coccidioides immitis TaxID=5501 RepID=A0A0J8TV16_COCIT|nr:aerobactin siderophore biosynthesis protein iucB [Coccidioides immitis RMSCC 3703]KMU85600.1 aerobactin siderophore biosynthesis protein iucB [Coccidioides immitis H538.4]TPX21547.1 hypothetical protein DIZ76_015506 [Coccidioides immitis]